MSRAGARAGGRPGMRERSDVVRNRQAILDAATRLYEDASEPSGITMDDIANAAGVGKGTVFRRFGDQAGLLRAVFDNRIKALTEAIQSGPPPLGPSAPAGQRIAAVLIAVIDFKIDNRRLTRALEDIEQRPGTGRFFETPNYQWAHTLLSELLTGIVGAEASGFCAHALLSLTRVDLIEHLIDSEKYTRAQLHHRVLDYASHLTEQPREAASPRRQ
jgi:AcrR family transcriptional regulator